MSYVRCVWLELRLFQKKILMGVDGNVFCPQGESALKLSVSGGCKRKWTVALSFS